MTHKNRIVGIWAAGKAAGEASCLTKEQIQHFADCDDCLQHAIEALANSLSDASERLKQKGYRLVLSRIGPRTHA